ncbi:MAG: RluA family pseudouridine synthase, partial [Acidobacteriota bacterium]
DMTDEKTKIPAEGQETRDKPAAERAGRDQAASEKAITAAPRVLFENEAVLAVDKPEGVVSISEAGKGGLPELLRELGVFGGRLYPVHRLDREASGVIVFAKDPAMHRFLNGEFDRHAVRKTYLALVHGLISSNRGIINKPIREFGSGRMGVDDKRGKASSTEFKVYQRLRGFTLVRAYPLTGRRHQIRVHLYSLGHPIVGDLKYGERTLQEKFPRLMLHAFEIEFDLPSGKRLKIEAPAPESFAAVLKKLGLK